MTVRIPLAKPEITDADRNAVLDVLRTPNLSMGPKLSSFEKAMAAYAGCEHAVAVNSGTSALHLAVKALGLSPGSEVILPSFSFGALLNVLLQEQLIPIFVDIDKTTCNTTPQLIENAITPRTKAIIAVHTFGRPIAMPAIVALADRHGIPVIEDACEALGAEIDDRKVGSFGKVGLFAFYPNKQITTGEGGVLLTRDRALSEHAVRLRNQGRDISRDWHQHTEIGYSYRISDINCALGLSQLQRIENTLVARESLTRLYDCKLTKIDGVIRPSLTVPSGRISWFCYVIQLSAQFDEADRNRICKSLTRKGIGNARYFAPLHRQPVLTAHAAAQGVDLPVSDSVAARVIALPFFNQLTESEIDEVCAALADSLNEVSRCKK